MNGALVGSDLGRREGGGDWYIFFFVSCLNKLRPPGDDSRSKKPNLQTTAAGVKARGCELPMRT